MFTPLFIISSLLGLPALLATILSQVELWQRKEYRLDRILPAFTSPELLNFTTLYITTFFLTAISKLITPVFPTVANLLALTTLTTILTFYLARLRTHGLSRPQFTSKALLLTTITTTIVLLLIAFILFSPSPDIVRLAALLILVPLLMPFLTALINAATNPKKRRIIKQATRARSALPHLQVIGITGSYGKTSTKHFLSQLLPAAAVSKEHRNSEFTIAQDMLEQLTTASQTYIVEMGAYTRGEITALAKLAKPRLGLITAIGNQHLATFGSPANILKAKWELIEALPEDGVAILNADDEKLQKQRVTPVKTIWFSTKKPADVYVDNINIKPRSLTCRLHIKELSFNVVIPLVSKAALSSVVAAAAAAHALGANTNELVTRLNHLKPYPRTMELITTKEGAAIIDDSYSANEQGVLAAIHHLKHFSQSDQRVVLTPLIELGRQAQSVHQRIGRDLANTGAAVYVYGRAYQKELVAGAGQASQFHFITQPKVLVDQVTKDLSQDTVILLEGRIPEIVRKQITS